MSDNPKDCSICFHKQLTKPAITWCHECDQSLCADCAINHGFSNVSKSHTTIAIDGYLEIGQTRLPVDDKCKTHNEKYQLFCPSHDAALCPECIDDHAECRKITSLLKQTKNLKESETLRDVRQSLSDNEDSISVIEQSMEKYIKKINERTCDLKNEVAGIRRKIDEHLDKIEKNTMTRIDGLGAELSEAVSGKLAEITTRRAQISDLKKQFDDIEKHGTGIQMFLGLKTFEKKCKDDEEFIQSCLEDDDYIVQKVPNIRFHDKIADLTGTHEFGIVSEEKTTEKLKIKRSKTKQAQKVDPKPTSKEDVRAVLLHSFDTNGKDITGCDILTDGWIILSEYYPARMIVADENTGFAYDVPLKPHNAVADVAVIDYRTVAAVCNKNVVIVDIADKRVKSAVPIDGQGFGFVLREDSLLCCSSNAIQSIKIGEANSKSEEILKYSNRFWSYIDFYNDHMYVTNREDKSVQCYDNKLREIWSFQDLSMLQGPWGVAVDHHGYVYVACRTLHNVVVISPDGQTGRVLLTKDNGLSTPTGLHFDRAKNHLIVTNKENMALKFSIM